MEKGIIGRKIGMTQIFDETGKVIPVTVIEAGPCVVVQKKAEEKEGYASVQLGFSDVKDKHLTKPEKGHLDKAGVPSKKYLHEFRLDDCDALNIGDEVKVDLFNTEDRVDISGVSKGKGYAGSIKRWGFGRGDETHGGGPVHRHAGSMGANSSPSKVTPGKKMPGHLGAEKTTIQNLDVVKVDVENNLLVVKGAVPGPKGGIVYVKSSVKTM